MEQIGWLKILTLNSNLDNIWWIRHASHSIKKSKKAYCVIEIHLEFAIGYFVEFCYMNHWHEP